MRPLWKDILISLFMGMVVPWMVLNFAAALLEEEPEIPETLPQVQETVPETVHLPMLLRLSDGSTREMDMDDYLVRVVLAEMPASFETEALKAQAVVARTYTRRAYTTGGKHGDGSICTDPACCQAYITEADYLAKGGTEESIEKIKAAVAASSGYVLTYEGALIEATYFSCSGGRTEDAAAVWGTDYPYLQSVESPGEENAAHYTDTISYDAERLEALLGLDSSRLGAVTYTEGGGVDTIVIGGTEFKGTELRRLLGLRSTAFTLTREGDTITITTKGYGHRVGMSQYGADAMAVSGSSFEEILAYYYQGTQLIRLEIDESGEMR
ncbi:MAG: stage II sporulation protein D [Oscillospiraceae bacterium]|nr:stage II sporulation protein D [Oscillospiraceae bacterium]